MNKQNDVPEEEFDIAGFELECNVSYVEVINDPRETGDHPLECSTQYPSFI